MKISIDTSDLIDQVKVLEKIDADALTQARVDTVNIVTLMVREKAIKQTHAELNLSMDYIESRLQRDEARGVARARVVAPWQGATLQRFGISQTTQKVKFTNADILRLTGAASFDDGFVKGPKTRLPGGKMSDVWSERTGDKSRNIAANQKAAGIAVDVNRKGQKTIQGSFTMPLQNDNGLGVFVRKNGKIKHRYGPSVYQVFRRYINTNEKEIMQTMQDEFMVRLDGVIERASA